LYETIKEQNIQLALDLIADPFTNVNESYQDKTPLLIACQNNDLELINQLLAPSKIPGINALCPYCFAFGHFFS